MGIFKRSGKKSEESSEKLREMPTDGVSAEESAVDETVETEVPAEESAATETAKTEAPAEESAAEETVESEAPAEESTAEETVESEAPAEESTAEETAETEAPAEESAVDETAETEAPAEESAAEETVETEVPAEETAPVTKQAVDSEGNLREYYEAFVHGEAKTPKDGVKQVLFDLADILETVLVSVFVVLLAFTFLFSIATVEGDSMLPTLQSRERLLISCLDKNVKTGDILILNSQSANTFDEEGNLSAHEGLGKNIVKRLIAQGGQTVDIDFSAGIVYVDEQPLDEPYTSTLTNRDEGAFVFPITIPEGYVFVLGDNRSISKDSRHPQVGLIPEDAIVGTVKFRFSPFKIF